MREEDVDAVISIHNNMNENTWQQVMAWESLITPTKGTGTGREPKLLRFIGRPDELSPKARLKMLFGHPAPFDRHDWYVDRGEGEGGEVRRYIIDYYHDESEVDNDRRPSHLLDSSSVRSIQVDVRPAALDSFTSLSMRLVLMPFQQMKILYGGGHINTSINTSINKYSPPPFFAPSAMVLAEQRRVKTIGRQWQHILDSCTRQQQDLSSCVTEEDCQKKSIKLQRCAARVVCPLVAEKFDASTTSTTGSAPEKAYSDMVKCLEMFEVESRAVLQGKGEKR